MAKKKSNIILWIVGIILLLLVLSQLNILKIQPKSQPETVGIKVHYWNNGVEVIPKQGLFSVVTPPGADFNQISLDIYVTNTGNVPINNIYIADASPVEFKNAFNLTNSTLNIGDSVILSSNNMTTSQFEPYNQPVRFFINISVKNNFTNEITYTSQYVDLTIIPSNLELKSGTITLDGNLTYQIVTVYPGATILVGPKGYLNIFATKNISIYGAIIGDGVGYAGGIMPHYVRTGNSGTGPGYGGAGYEYVLGVSSKSFASGGGGAGHVSSGGVGGSCESVASGPAGITYGSNNYIFEMGSGGGSGGTSTVGDIDGGGPGGSGGASITLISKKITINGTISVNGSRGGDGHAGTVGTDSSGGGGGGSGGKIILLANDLNINGAKMLSKGGDGGNGKQAAYTGKSECGTGGGGGSGGSIIIAYRNSLQDTSSMIVNGGSGGTYDKSGSPSSCNAGTAGGNGSKYSSLDSNLGTSCCLTMLCVINRLSCGGPSAP
jgi:hypothetical protein